MWWTFWTSTGAAATFPAFNVADMGISVGAACLILDEILRSRRAKRGV
jgi:signal peptidase II